MNVLPIYQFKKTGSGDVFLDQPVNLDRYVKFYYDHMITDFYKPLDQQE